MVFKILRKRKNVKIILWIITILIIPGFFLWGVGVGSSRHLYYAAVVNRQPITLREFYKQLGKVEEKYREIFGDRYSEIRDKFNIEKDVLENMIREKILLNEAKRRRIKIFKNEIIEAVKSDPVFKNEKGEFDPQKYKEIMERIPDEELRRIEQEIRKEILINKLKEQVISETNIQVSDTEIDEYIKKTNGEKIDRESIRKILLWQKREKYFNDWYSNLRKNAKVIIYIPLEKGEKSG